MKVYLYKKTLFFSMLFIILSLKAHTQMLDLMGSMAVEETQTVDSVRSVNQMKQALYVGQFLNHLQMKIAQITTSYFGNYQNMPIQNMNYQNIKVVFRPVNEGRNFEAFISPLSQQLCQKLVNTQFDNLAYFRFINNGMSSDSTFQQARSNAGLCVVSDAIALILE